ncbi:MAG TPA: type VI secretion system tube protein Hcp, partial [Methyloversatilis sp.]
MTNTLRSARLRPATLVAAFLAVAATGAAHAGTGIFLQLKDPDIAGSSLRDTGDSVTNTPRWIDVNSTSLSISAEVSYRLGGGGSPAIGKAKLDTLSWSQWLDVSVPRVAGLITTGKSVATATFDYVKNSGGAGKPSSPYMTLKMENAFMTDLSYGMSSEGITVDASMAPKTIALTYTPTNPDGKPGTEIKADWDIPTSNATVHGSPALIRLNTQGSAAAPGLYLRFGDSTGKTIAGDSTVSGYENWIRVDDASWKVSAETSWIKSSGASIGKPIPDVFSWTQALDRSFPFTFAAIAGGKALPTATLEYVGDGGLTLMQTVMEAPLLTNLTLDNSSDGGSVSGSMVFKSISQTVWGIDPRTGGRTAPVSFNWDIVTGKYTGTAPEAPKVSNFGAGNIARMVAAASESELPPAAPLPIPEPGTWAMMLGGLAVLGCAARARRQ